MMLFIGDVSDEKGWRSVHLDMETGTIIEVDQDGGEVSQDREPTAKELLIAVTEWAALNQESPFPVNLYSAIKRAI